MCSVRVFSTWNPGALWGWRLAMHLVDLMLNIWPPTNAHMPTLLIGPAAETQAPRVVWLRASGPVLHVVCVYCHFVSWNTNYLNEDYFCSSVLKGAFTVCSSTVNLLHPQSVCSLWLLLCVSLFCFSPAFFPPSENSIVSAGEHHCWALQQHTSVDKHMHLNIYLKQVSILWSNFM